MNSTPNSQSLALISTFNQFTKYLSGNVYGKSHYGAKQEATTRSCLNQRTAPPLYLGLVHPHNVHRGHCPPLIRKPTSVPRPTYSWHHHLYPRSRSLPTRHTPHRCSIRPFPRYTHAFSAPSDRAPIHPDLFPHPCNLDILRSKLRCSSHWFLAGHHPSDPLLDIRCPYFPPCNYPVPLLVHWQTINHPIHDSSLASPNLSHHVIGNHRLRNRPLSTRSPRRQHYRRRCHFPRSWHTRFHFHV